MTTKQAWIAVGVAAAVLAFGYLASKREIDVHATVTEGQATITYLTGVGSAPAPSAQEDSHAKMLQLIDESNTAISNYDATHPDSPS